MKRIILFLLLTVGAFAQGTGAGQMAIFGPSSGGGGGGTPGGVDGDWQKNVAGSFGGVTPATGWDTLFGTPSSANLAAWITNETGSGLLVFGTAPTLSGAILSGTTTASTINVTTLTASTLEPTTNDGAPLGSTSKQWSDLFLAEGGVINWDNGDATLTQAGNVVTLAGAVLAADVGTSTATTASAGDASTKVATTAYADTAAKATLLGSYGTPNTAAGAITWTSAVYEVWTNTTTTYALPAASTYAGKAVIFYVTGTNLITIDPNGSEVIVRDGTAQTGGVTMTLAGVAGNYVCMVCDGTRWITLGFKGTLAAGS